MFFPGPGGRNQDFKTRNDLQNHQQDAGHLDFLDFFSLTSPKKLFVVFKCGHLSIRKQSAKRSGQEGATKRQRRVIQLSLGSNRALSFGSYFSNDCCRQEPLS